MAILYLKKNYYDALDKTQNNEFVRKTRAYFRIYGLKYKGECVEVAVPLRANINPNFLKDKGDYIATLPTSHTRQGNWAGWHITKMIPFDGELFNKRRNKITDRDMLLAEHTAKAYIKDMQLAAQKLLNRIEAGENVFGVIEFNSALKLVARLKKQGKPSGAKRQ